MTQICFEINTSDLPEFAQLANACAVAPGSVQVHFPGLGEYRYDRVALTIPQDQLRHFWVMSELMGRHWDYHECSPDPVTLTL